MLQEKLNKAKLIGTIAEPLKLEDPKYGDIYTTILEAKRFSQTIDRIPVRIPETAIKDLKIGVGTRVCIDGECRSRSINHHLDISIFAKKVSIVDTEGIDVNEIEMIGFICKQPIYRTTPLGRKICDIMLAVPRTMDESAYIPCIAWGRNAEYVDNLPVGLKLNLEGRMQSRDYSKIIEGEAVIRTAIELSCSLVALV